MGQIGDTNVGRAWPVTGSRPANESRGSPPIRLKIPQTYTEPAATTVATAESPWTSSSGFGAKRVARPFARLIAARLRRALPPIRVNSPVT